MHRFMARIRNGIRVRVRVRDISVKFSCSWVGDGKGLE